MVTSDDNQGPALPPDRDQAERFLSLLDEDAERFTFQTFDDSKDRKDHCLVRVLHGTLAEHWPELCRLNQAGAGVFVTVNETDLRGRKTDNIVGVRAIFQEADRPGCPELPTPAHIVVESSPGKHHRYILLDGCPLDGFGPLQARMVESYGSDPNAKDLARVLRLPGFYHQKEPDHPHMVRIVSESGELPLRYAEAVQVFPPVQREAHPAQSNTGDQGGNLEEVQSALSALNPDMGYNDWLLVGMALHDWSGGSAVGLEAWGRWSSNGAKYQAGECSGKWGTFGGGKKIATIKTVFDMAAKTGWRWEGGQTGQEQAEPEEWEPPVDLDTPDLPGFTAADFPAILWAMIEGIARATETPVELPAMGVLAVAATACQRRVKIELDPGYTEPLNLWTLTALPPGSRKSAVQRLAIAPLQSWEIERGQAMAPEIRAARATRAAEEGRLKELQKKFGKEQDETKRSTLLEEITNAEAALPEVPRKPRVFGQDVTAEKTGALLADHGEKIGIFSTEGGIFDILAGRYSSGVPNMDVFLQAHAGDQVRVDRGSRPPVDLQEPALSMGLSIQPSVLNEMAGKAAFRGRGLIGRFLYACPPDIVGKRTLETVPVSPSVRAGYDQAIIALLDLPEQRNMLTGELYAIQLTPEAHADWKAFAREVENGMAEGGPLESLRDWAGKAAGAAGRIACKFQTIPATDST